MIGALPGVHAAVCGRKGAALQGTSWLRGATLQRSQQVQSALLSLSLKMRHSSVQGEEECGAAWHALPKEWGRSLLVCALGLSCEKRCKRRRRRRNAVGDNVVAPHNTLSCELTARSFMAGWVASLLASNCNCKHPCLPPSARLEEGGGQCPSWPQLASACQPGTWTLQSRCAAEASLALCSTPVIEVPDWRSGVMN